MKPVFWLTLTLVLAALLPAWAAAPVISNVRASQRPGTKLVDITYDLGDADGGTQTIGVEISADGGQTYTIPATALTGAVGTGVALGANKAIVWNAGIDWNGQYVPTARIRLTTNDGSTPAPPAGMVYIPAGSFQMGDSFYELGANTLPLHNVQVNAMFMDKYEVTKELWSSVYSWALGHGYNFTYAGTYRDNGHPVEQINWYDAVKWCNARSEKEGRTPCYYTNTGLSTVYRSGQTDITNSMVNWSATGYRLPTEAEWEKAARGGPLGNRYPFGNNIAGNNANFSGSGDALENGNPQTTPVGYYNGTQTPTGADMANGYGLYDMAGNVAEWCWDWYGDTYYSSSAANDNPRGPASGIYKLLRGGGWPESTDPLRCAYRNDITTPSNTVNYFGFRCVRGL